MGVLQAKQFNLRLTLESGQFFRYAEDHGAYILITGGKTVRVRQEDNTLHFSGASQAFVERLLGLDEGYARQCRRLSKDPVLAPLLRRYRGLRIMRQDLHEAIIGFICSSQSNIPKIRMNLNLLAQGCGAEMDGYYHLPKPGIALNYDIVRSAKTGYRAKFIVAANERLDPLLLYEISAAQYVEAHTLLCGLPGVGPKIADCVCLFALGHGGAFPVDVHVARAMRVLFPGEDLSTELAIKHFAQQRWGTDAGLAQQFIFQWARDSAPAMRSR
jgi:N-glycosylase/DNA lyase